MFLMLMSVTFDGLLSIPAWKRFQGQLPHGFTVGSAGYVFVAMVAFAVLVGLAWTVFGLFAKGVRDVGHLRPCRPQVFHHRLQHLRRHDHRLVLPPRAQHQLLLRDRHRLRRQLDAQVAARHHDPARRIEDLVDAGQRLRLLDLRDYRRRLSC